jgi:hypothetical protein
MAPLTIVMNRWQIMRPTRGPFNVWKVSGTGRMKRRLGGRLGPMMYSRNQGCCGSTGVTPGGQRRRCHPLLCDPQGRLNLTTLAKDAADKHEANDHLCPRCCLRHGGD